MQMAREKNCLILNDSKLDCEMTALEVEADNHGVNFTIDPDDGNKYTLTISRNELVDLINFLQKQVK
jgi:hypothetical protein